MTSHKQSFSIQLTHSSADETATYHHEDFPLVSIGRQSFIAGPSSIVHTGLPDGMRSSIRIGNFCSIADKVTFILRGNHHPEWITTFPIAGNNGLWPADVPKPDDLHASNKGNIVIGHDVWIGQGVQIMAGAVVGNGAVIGAGAVVAKDVPPYSIFVGNPGAVKRFRFAPGDIAYLQATQWWNFPLETIRQLIPTMASSDFSMFRKKCDQMMKEGLAPSQKMVG